MVRDAEKAPNMLHMDSSRCAALDQSRSQCHALLRYTIQAALCTSVCICTTSC